MEATDLPLAAAAVRASSVLQRNVKLYGPRLALEESEDSCWSSDQGTPQWLQLDFAAPVDTSALSLTFQGGFCGQACRVDVICAPSPSGAQAAAAGSVAGGAASAAGGAGGGGVCGGGGGGAASASDAALPGAAAAAAAAAAPAWRTVAEFEPEDNNRAQTFACAAARVTRLRVVFARSTDFYGRVTVYRLRLTGAPSPVP
jgi:hypothetical protein